MADTKEPQGPYGRGELQDVLIGTVVAAGEDGITAAEVYAKLVEWGRYKGSSATVTSYLAKLARKGVIDTQSTPQPGVPSRYIGP